MLQQNLQLYKAYIFSKKEEFQNSVAVNENEDEVIVMQGIQKMAKEFREESVIWYDSNTDFQSKEQFIESLEVDKESVLSYDFEILSQKLDLSPDYPYHLILTNEDEANRIIEKFGNFKGLLRIFVYSNDSQTLKSSSSKVIKTGKNFEAFSKIKKEIDSRLRLDFPAFMTNFHACDKQKVYNLHLFLQNITYKNRKQAKNDFLKLAREVYPAKKAVISEFEENYSDYDKVQILEWYTRPSPINKLINNCLRIATLDSLMWARFVLKDLERAIREHYQEERIKFSGKVYRAAYLSQEEWIRFERNPGQDIEVLGFFSTSKNQRKVQQWVHDDPEKKVLMKIIIFPLLEWDSQGFADLTMISKTENEEEILFNLNARFQIAKTEMREGIRCVTLFYDPSLSSSIMRNKESSRLKIKLPSDLERKCQRCEGRETLSFNFETNKIFCERCLNKQDTMKSLPLAEPLQTKNILDFSLGLRCDVCIKLTQEVYYKTKNAHKCCQKCFQGHQKSKLNIYLRAVEDPNILFEDKGDYEMTQLDFINSFPGDSSQVSQGDLFFAVQNYDKCLEYCGGRMEQIITKRDAQKERLWLSDLMGKSSTYLSFKEEAKDYLFKLCRRIQAIFGKEHPKTAVSYHNLAIMFMNFSEMKNTRKFFKLSLKIVESVFSEKPLKTVKALTTLAAAYMISGKSQKGIQNFKKALDIALKINGKKHPNTAKLYKNLFTAYESLGNDKEERDNFQNTLHASATPSTKEAPSKAASCYLLAAALQSRVINENFNDDRNISGKFLSELKETKQIFLEKISKIEYPIQYLVAICESLGEIQKVLDVFLEIRDSRTFTYQRDFESSAALQRILENISQRFEENAEKFGSLKQYMNIESSKFEEEHKITGGECHYAKKCFENRDSGQLFLVKRIHENLATLKKSLGKYQKAFEHAKEALNITKFINGKNHPETASSFHILALISHSFHRNSEALDFYLNAIEIQKLNDCQNCSCLLTYYHGLASIYEHLGDYLEALRCREKALDISVHAEKLPEVASSCNYIALTYEAMEKYKKAQEYHEKAGQIITSICEEEKHLDIATSYNNTGSIKLVLAQVEEAFDYFSKALSITISLKGEKHLSVATSLLNLARVERYRMNYKEELKICIEATGIFKSILGDKHSSTAASLNSIAMALNSDGKYKEAIDFAQRALNISMSIHGPKHSDTAASYNNIANLYAKQGDIEMALKNSERALEITRLICGEEHSETAASFSNLGSLYWKNQKHEQAMEYYKKALKISKSVFGKNHPQTALLYNNIALVDKAKGEFQKAASRFRKAVKSCTSVKEHPPSYLATIYSNFGTLCMSLRDNKKALEFFQKALDIREELLEENHPETQSLYINLAKTHEVSGNDQEASNNLSKVLQHTIPKKTQKAKWKKL